MDPAAVEQAPVSAPTEATEIAQPVEVLAAVPSEVEAPSEVASEPSAFATHTKSVVQPTVTEPVTIEPTAEQPTVAVAQSSSSDLLTAQPETSTEAPKEM